MKRAGIVLCGGRSRRMGRPKALLPWLGRRMVDHVVERLAPCVDEVLVVTSTELERLVFPIAIRESAPAARGPVRRVLDSEPGRGPLAALRDGLAATDADLAFVTATDAPFLEAAHVEALLREAMAAVAERRDGEPRAIVPRAGGFLQVLSAVYPRTAGREAAALLAAGIASPAALAERIGARIVDVAASAEPAPWTGFNTPAEYLALARRCDPAARARVEWRLEDADDATSVREVPIGSLGEVLRAAAPGAADRERALAQDRLRVVLAEGELPRDFDEALPIGPGERVLVRERRPGSERARGPSR